MTDTPSVLLELIAVFCFSAACALLLADAFWGGSDE